MKKIIQKALFCLYVLLGNLQGFTQHIGIPIIESFSVEEHKYGIQNWDMTQGENGLLYFANNDGLLEFNGSTWSLFPLPNKTILRSLHMKDKVIYGGGQNEFGKFIPHKTEKWVFKSLRENIPPAHRNFEDVWGIESRGDTIYFMASAKIYALAGKDFTVLEEAPVWFLGKAGSLLFTQKVSGELFHIQHNRLIPVSYGNLIGTKINDIIKSGEGYVIATHKSGLYYFNGETIKKWKNDAEDIFKTNYIRTANRLSNGNLVFGTAFSGLVVLSPEGAIIHHITNKDGLHNNGVICSFVDINQNLWLGLDKGISLVQTNSSFTQIVPDGDLNGIGYVTKVFGDKVYFGTNNGLYYTSWGKNTTDRQFYRVENTNGQVWGLNIIDEKLYLNHKDGLFRVDGDAAVNINNTTGFWLLKQLNANPDKVVAGTYQGVSLFEKSGNGLIASQVVPELSESSRFLEEDQSGKLWMAHPYRGIFRIENLKTPKEIRVKALGADEGLPSNLHNHLFMINGELLICAEKGVYTYNENKNGLIPYGPINELLGEETKVRRLYKSANEDIWFITEDEIGLLKIIDRGLSKEITKKAFPRLKKKLNDGFENIYAHDLKNVFIATTNGFLHYNPVKEQLTDHTFSIQLSEVRLNGDSIIYTGSQSLSDETGKSLEEYTFKYQENYFSFSLAATEYIDNKGVKFKYFLDGFDESWSDWTNTRLKEYTNLPPGNYSFFVKAMNSDEKVVEARVFQFEITNAFYASFPALILYIFVSVALILFFISNSRKKIKALEEKADTSAVKSKEEIQRLESEKTNAELDHKNRELISATMHLIRKNKTLDNIREQLINIKKESNDKDTSIRLDKLISFLRKNEVIDEGWEQLTFHFNKLHGGFFDRLKKEYPSLTPRDLKLCAYLKMNLSTKEIATLMNASIRGVEASRYRLRKKLNLQNNENLTEFIMDYYGKPASS